MGKISAGGVLHQLLWNLSHTPGYEISIVVPATFVGCESAMAEPIETGHGKVYKMKEVKPYQIKNKLEYNSEVSEDYLEFPVIRAGENHVYSECELKALTAIGQMEAITKEEVALSVMEDILGNSNRGNILMHMDSGMLEPSYLGKQMVENMVGLLHQIPSPNAGIATGNLGVTCAKNLYELYYLKLVSSKITELIKLTDKQLMDKLSKVIEKETNLVTEVISLGLPVLYGDNEIYIGNYSLVGNDSKKITPDVINKWARTGWVDLRKENMLKWVKNIKEVWDDIKSNNNDRCKLHLAKDDHSIKDDFDIAELLAYHYNINGKGRKK
jgi:hypothetical protein